MDVVITSESHKWFTASFYFLSEMSPEIVPEAFC